MGVLLECSGLTKRFGKREALKQVDLSVESGKIVGLLGPNGSGKTTLIKLANGLLRPDGGSIRIDGQEPGVYTKSIVSYLPDRMYFADWMRVSDMVRMFRDFYTDFRLETAEDMLERLEISGSERMKSLSKGTKEKVQLAGNHRVAFSVLAYVGISSVFSIIMTALLQTYPLWEPVLERMDMTAAIHVTGCAFLLWQVFQILTEALGTEYLLKHHLNLE